VDGSWRLDPNNPRTRQRTVHRDNVWVVAGTPEPLLFAPALPHCVPHPRGGYRITALLRKGFGSSLRIAWSEGRPDTESVMPMSRVSEEQEHIVFRSHLPTSTPFARFRFLLDDGTFVGQENGHDFDIPKCIDRLPSFWEQAVVYTIFVDRFRPQTDHSAWADDPGPDLPAYGHIDGITRSLDSLADLGVTVLHLTPIHVGASCHRYDVIDPLTVDPAIGGEQALRRLLDAAHQRGLRVLLDFSMLHVGTGFAPYEQVKREGPGSSLAPWFRWRDRSGHLQLDHYGGRVDAPLLNLDHEPVQELALQAVKHWTRFGIDGFRLDAAAQVPLSLGTRIRDTLRENAPHSLVLGEVVPAHAWRWQQAGVVDAATDFSFHATMTSFLAERSIDAATAAERIEYAVSEALSANRAVRFLSTHDHNRFATLCAVRGAPNRTALGMLMLVAMPGTPLLVYGEELGMAAKIAALRPEGAWEDRVPMPWSWSETQIAFRSLTRSLLQARRNHPALHSGDMQIVYAEDRLLVLRRALGNDIVDVVINASDSSVELSLDDDWLELLEPVASTGDVRVQDQQVCLGANSGLLAQRKPRQRPAGVIELMEKERKRRHNEAFASGRSEAPVRPSRIDFSITERCNVRCRHCINHSPDRVQQQTARTLSPAVLDRIREDLAHASYFGFVHGGESLTAPIFFDVLEAIRFARAGAPTVIHLLSNGMLLTPDVVERLVQAGVSSISLSIDGASPSVHDRIRVGSRLSVIEKHVEKMVELRHRHQLDLRIGLSCVVMTENQFELLQIVHLAARLGMDWVKFEELVASTEFARQWLVDPQGEETRNLVEEAVKQGRRLGLTMVDHTAPPRVWRCKLKDSPQMASFLGADQFANRSVIHPCRAAWEHVCIEPNGDVHIASFHGAVIGNVMAEPLTMLWNGSVAQSERMRSRLERICGDGPVTCLSENEII
ncbi:MAG TPA: alpha-amylase family glycosyl hydrolase, partial [Polyangiaceae bacterium]|nr:alpha-amylase family glycosyl hydrolase [Polyangiaceae bacterium]